MNAFFERVVYGITVFTLIVLCVAIRIGSAGAQTAWEYNPNNYKNAEYNYFNSQYNYANSQYNWDNAQYNYNSRNGVYDNDGNRIAYARRNNEGTVNIFDNDGDRIGYSK
jgi:hypothetical protein